MKTYAESNGFPTFNWNDFLSRDKTTITNAQWSEAQQLAKSWPTCACGNLCDAIPRRPLVSGQIIDGEEVTGGAPIDGLLYDAGLAFNRAMYRRDLALAREAFERVEARSTQLLTEMGIVISTIQEPA